MKKALTPKSGISVNSAIVRTIVLSIFLLAFIIGFKVQPADAQISSAACTNLTVNLRYPNTDAMTLGQVSKLQQFLIARAYMTGTPTGYFGTVTRSAVEAFQAQYGITGVSPRGFVGPSTREKIRSLTCDNQGSLINNQVSTQDFVRPIPGQGSIDRFGVAQGITVTSPTGSLSENFVSGGSISVAIDNPIPNPTSNANGMSYAVDLVASAGNSVRLGTIYVTVPTQRHIATFTIPSSVWSGSGYRIRVSPSCNSLSVQCVLAYSASFSIGTGTGTNNQGPFVRIISPTTIGTLAKGAQQNLRLEIPSDKKYSTSYYLMPSVTPTGTASGSYYNPTTGGYGLGSHTPSSAMSTVDNWFTVPTDIPNGTYKLRVFLRNEGETSGNPTIATTLAYVDTASFTIGTTGSQNTTATFNITSPTGNATWKVGETKQLAFTATGMPSTAYIVLSWTPQSGSQGGGSMGAVPLPTNGVLNFTVPIGVFNGDVGSQLLPGNYTLTATVYDMASDSQILAAKTVQGVITISSDITMGGATSTAPYFRVKTPATGFVYASTTPTMAVAWELGNVNFDVQYFQVHLQNKMSPGQWFVLGDVAKTTTTATYKITDQMVNQMVQGSGGKTKDQIKASYFIKVFSIGRKGMDFTSTADAESPTFTVQLQ